jgi:hypothetical protein
MIKMKSPQQMKYHQQLTMLVSHLKDKKVHLGHWALVAHWGCKTDILVVMMKKMKFPLQRVMPVSHLNSRRVNVWGPPLGFR